MKKQNESTSEMPLFSILMPVYNVEDFLSISINSILDQEFSDWELIIVNDGSTDSSCSICEGYLKRDRRIRLINKQNEGLISARRTGVSLAKGKYTLFLDSDDFLEKQCLQRLESIVNSYDVDIIMYSGYLFFDEQNKKSMELSFKEGYVSKADIYKKILTSDELNAIWTKCIRTSILKGDPTDYKAYYHNSYGEDKLQFFYPITIAKTVYYLPLQLVNYRQSETSMIHNVNVSMIEKKLHLEVWDVLCSYAKEWGMWDEEQIEKMSVYFVRHMLNTFSNVFSACNIKEKYLCVSYDWKGRVPDWLLLDYVLRNISFKDKAKIHLMFHLR